MRILSVHNRYRIRGGEDESREAEERILRDGGHFVDTYEDDNHRVAELGLLRAALRAVWSNEAYRDVEGRLRRRAYDVVHVQNFFPLISPSVYYAASAAGVPVVQTLRNYRLLCVNALLFKDGGPCERCIGKLAPWRGVAAGCYRGSRRASASVAAMLLVHNAIRTWSRMVRVYIALTEFSRGRFIEGGLPAKKIVVKPNFVHPDPGVGDGRGGYALLVSRLSVEKGVETVLGAWRQLGGKVPLKIIGDGPLASAVAGLARDVPGVELLGRMSVEAVYDLMGEATFVLLPSKWYETFGRVAIEAFAKGTPVIASRLGAMAEVVSHGRTGMLFEAGNSTDLAEKVEELISSRTAVGRMRENARREFVARYTAERNYRSLQAIYRAAIEGGEPARALRVGL